MRSGQPLLQLTGNTISLPHMGVWINKRLFRRVGYAALSTFPSYTTPNREINPVFSFLLLTLRWKLKDRQTDLRSSIHVQLICQLSGIIQWQFIRSQAEYSNKQNTATAQVPPKKHARQISRKETALCAGFHQLATKLIFTSRLEFLLTQF